MRGELAVSIGLSLVMFLGLAFAQESGLPRDAETRAILAELQEKLRNAGPVSYEIMVTEDSSAVAGGGARSESVQKMKLRQKGAYTRVEMVSSHGRMYRSIYHPDAMYLYDASKDRYLRTLTKDSLTQAPLKALTGLVEESLKGLRIVGSEILDGKPATVVESSTPFGPGTIIVKTWYWNETGLPLKIETTTKVREKIISRQVQESRNFVFEDIPDNLFEVPEEKIIDADVSTSASEAATSKGEELD